ncbi:MAG: ABC transporter permease [Thiohalomonadaceae bacterium]
MNFVLAMLIRDFGADIRALRFAMIRLVIQPAVYLFVFGHVVGGMFSAGGSHYAETMAPGIVAIAIMSGPVTLIASSILPGYYYRTLEGWLLAPVSLRLLLISKVLGGVLYGMVSGAVVVGLVWLLLGFAPASLSLLLAIGVTAALFFSLLMLVVLCLPRTPDKGQEAFSFVLMPLTFFGCTFYSHSMLEAPYSQLALMLPTTYVSEGLRAAYNPSLPHLPLEQVMLGIGVSTLLLLPIAEWAFRRRLRDFLW